jgi:hypothetical protein
MCEDVKILVIHTNSHHLHIKCYLFWRPQASLKYLIPEMQRHVLSSPSQHSEARVVMPDSGDPQKAPGLECIKYLPELGTSIKFSWWYAMLLSCDL